MSSTPFRVSALAWVLDIGTNPGNSFAELGMTSFIDVGQVNFRARFFTSNPVLRAIVEGAQLGQCLEIFGRAIILPPSDTIASYQQGLTIIVDTALSFSNMDYITTNFPSRPLIFDLVSPFPPQLKPEGGYYTLSSNIQQYVQGNTANRIISAKMNIPAERFGKMVTSIRSRKSILTSHFKFRHYSLLISF